MMYILHAHDNSYKTTITAVFNYIKQNVNLDLKDIELFKTSTDTNIFHFSSFPKMMYMMLKDIEFDERFDTKSIKENHRVEMVKWIESQKAFFGENVWAKQVHNVNSKGLWIGDLRFQVELNEINLIDEPKRFIGVEIINGAKSETHYKQDVLDLNYDLIIKIHTSQDYKQIVKSIHNQLIKLV